VKVEPVQAAPEEPKAEPVTRVVERVQIVSGESGVDEVKKETIIQQDVVREEAPVVVQPAQVVEPPEQEVEQVVQEPAPVLQEPQPVVQETPAQKIEQSPKKKSWWNPFSSEGKKEKKPVEKKPVEKKPWKPLNFENFGKKQ
jgi:hypothetical protein